MTEAEKFMEKVDALIASRDTTYKELERNLGLGNGFFGKLRMRDALPTIPKIDVIAKYFGVNRAFLIDAETLHGSDVKIPLVGRVAAGLPIEASENLIGYEEIPQALAGTGSFFALYIKGDSMSPDIQDGDKVIVRQQNEVENNQIAIVLINGHDAVCKEFKKTDSGVMLISRNPNYAPMVFTHAEIDTTPVKVIGRVIEVRREL